jgi:transposase
VASSKDDGFDAFVLADSLRHERGHWRPLGQLSDTLAELRSLVRDRRPTLETQQAVEAQLRSTLEAFHPAAARLFSSVDRDIILAFIRTYSTPEQAERLGEVRMDRFLRRHSYRGRVPAEILVRRLRANLLSGCGGTTLAKRHAALGQADLLELLNRQLREFDRTIETVVARHPDEAVFRSFPGVGTILSAMLLAEIGEDRSRYPVADVLLAEAGLAPVTRSSGRTVRVRFRYAANATMREAFMWWAYNSIKLSPWARNSYDAAKGGGQHHYRVDSGSLPGPLHEEPAGHGAQVSGGGGGGDRADRLRPARPFLGHGPAAPGGRRAPSPVRSGSRAAG